MDSLWIVIPTAYRHKYLNQIFLKSEVSPERIILIRTTGGEEIPGAVNIWVYGEINIQKWWNIGIDFAKKNGARYVAILNDDTILEKGDLLKLFWKIKEDGTTLAVPVNQGEAGWGHCWILDTFHNIFPDERFSWWCGDHDLEIRALKTKGVSYLPLPILNKHPNELTVLDPRLQVLTKKDIWIFRKKYPLRFLREIWTIFRKKLLKN